MKKIKQAVVLCAGKGERMGNSFRNVQKCAMAIQGRPLVVEITGKLIGLGCEKIILLTGHQPEQVKQCLCDKPYANLLRFVYCGDPYKISLTVLTTLVYAKRHINGPFLCLHGDILFEGSILNDLVATFNRNSHFIAIAVAKDKRPALTHTRIVYDSDFIVYRADAPEDLDADIYMGIDIYQPEIFDYCGDTLHPRDLLQKLLAEEKKIRAVIYDKQWFHLVINSDLI